MTDDFNSLVNDAEKNAKAMQGWDFSYIMDRRHLDCHPWNYSETVCSMLGDVHDMLDIDTGGGEVLHGIWEKANDWPDSVYATEGYKPNVVVATRKLQPIGVEVVEYGSSDKLPFEDESFDFIINRHGDYSVREVKRILRQHGVFLTQQIGFGTKISFNNLLGGPEPAYENVDFSEIVTRFEKSGFDIIVRQKYNGRDVFNDIGAVVFVLTAAPWELPGFSVERYRDQLYKLHESIKSDGPIDIGISYFLLGARKCKETPKVDNVL
jgi:SAM-dependent methyltransferase